MHYTWQLTAMTKRPHAHSRPCHAGVCTVFASLPSACSPMKQAPTASGATAAVTTAGMDCLTPCSGAPTPVSGVRRGKGKQELCGPCCHCGATSSPQWRKGPKGKPILCNACGIRFLRTRSLGKVTPKKRRSPVGGSVVHSAAAKRLKLDDEDTEDGDEGRTSSGGCGCLDVCWGQLNIGLGQLEESSASACSGVCSSMINFHA